MNNKKGTKRALLTSLLMLLLSCSMFVGSTFAWFTDSVVSKNNIITSGNLDVVLEYKTNWSDEWAPVDENVAVFNENALYEPGYTEVVFLRVSNAGTLALKYNLDVNVYTEATSVSVEGNELKLSDYLEVGAYVQDEYSSGANYAEILMPVMFADRASAINSVNSPDGTGFSKLSADWIAVKDSPVLPGNETSKVVALVLTMPEIVGNEANYDMNYAAPTIELGIALTAAQYTHESDTFGTDYDANAEYGEIVANTLPKATVQALNPAEVNGGNRINLYDVTSLNQTGETVLVDVAYKFTAQDTYETAKESEYSDWYTDYVISFDRPVLAGSAGLAGYYGNFGITEWIAFTAPTDVPANEEIPLLEALMGQTIPYYAICRDVAVFECGAFNLDPANAGTVMNVQLRLTNPADPTDFVVAGEFNYTFK